MSQEIKKYWKNYIDGQWVDAANGERIIVENPATAQPLAEVARATEADVDLAVAGAIERPHRRAREPAGGTDLAGKKHQRRFYVVAPTFAKQRPPCLVPDTQVRKQGHVRALGGPPQMDFVVAAPRVFLEDGVVVETDVARLQIGVAGGGLGGNDRAGGNAHNDPVDVG